MASHSSKEYNKNYRETHKEYLKEYFRKWRRKHGIPERKLLTPIERKGYGIIKSYKYRNRKNNRLKIEARRKVFIALRNKSLKKKECFCGDKKVEAHHEDYLKPLDIIWFCKKHHLEADKKLSTLQSF